MFFIKMRRISRHRVSLVKGKSILQLKTKHKTFLAKEKKKRFLDLDSSIQKVTVPPGSIRNGGVEEGRSAEISFPGQGL